MDSLLSVDSLRTYIETDDRTIRAADGVSFTVDAGETVCLVGESGSGKSVTCESISRIIPQPPAKIVDGSVTFDGVELLDSPESVLRSIRGNRIAHVFQNPQQALDPVYTVGDQIAEAIEIHDDVAAGALRGRGIDLLRKVGIPNAETRIDDYPHEFSGGMAQRVAIAIALAADPDLLIADEPTTAVDVTVQARIIELLDELTDEGMALLLVTHDLRVVAALADRVVAMFGGTVIETGPTEAVFERPAHPYTQALFESYDGLERREDRSARDQIPTSGCRFAQECPYAVEECHGDDQPPHHAVGGRTDHTASCVYYGTEYDPTEIIEAGATARPAAAGDDDD